MPDSPARPLATWQAYLLAFIAGLLAHHRAGRRAHYGAAHRRLTLYLDEHHRRSASRHQLGQFYRRQAGRPLRLAAGAGSLFLVSGLAALSVLYTASALSGYKGPASLPLMARIVVLTGAIFFLPSLTLGTISPLLVKLTLRDLNRSATWSQAVRGLDGGQHRGRICHRLLPHFALWHPANHAGRQPGMLFAGALVRRLVMAWERRARLASILLLLAAGAAGYWLVRMAR